MINNPTEQPNTSREALLPCPFCGGKAMVCGVLIFEVTHCAIQCNNCGVRSDSFQYEADAIQSWNTRAQADLLAKLDSPELVAPLSPGIRLLVTEPVSSPRPTKYMIQFHYSSCEEMHAADRRYYEYLERFAALRTFIEQRGVK